MANAQGRRGPARLARSRTENSSTLTKQTNECIRRENQMGMKRCRRIVNRMQIMRPISRGISLQIHYIDMQATTELVQLLGGDCNSAESKHGTNQYQCITRSRRPSGNFQFSMINGARPCRAAAKTPDHSGARRRRPPPEAWAPRSSRFPAGSRGWAR